MELGSLKRFPGSGVTHLPAAKEIDSTGRKTALAAVRDTIEPVKALQQSANGASMPFAAPCRWHLSFVQFARDAAD